MDRDLLTNLTARGSQELDKVLKYAAGGRDHLSCQKGRDALCVMLSMPPSVFRLRAEQFKEQLRWPTSDPVKLMRQCTMGNQAKPGRH